jgi:hypothetical protein
MKKIFTEVKSFRSGIIIILGIVWCLICYINCFKYSGKFTGIDYYQFWALGKAISQPDTGNIYSAEERIRLGNLYYEKAIKMTPNSQVSSRQLEVAKARITLSGYSTPFLYTIFGMSSTEDYVRDWRHYRLFIFIIYFLVLIGLTVFFKISIFEMFFLFPFLTIYCMPFISEITVFNVNIIQLLFLYVFLVCYHRKSYIFKIISGMTLGGLIAFKPNVALPIFFFLFGIMVDKNYSILKQLLTGMFWGVLIAIVGSGIWVNGLSIWLDWLKSMNELFSDTSLPFARGNYSLYRIIEELYSRRVAQIISLVLISIGLFVIWIRRNQNTIDNNNFFERDVARLGIGFAISFLSSGLTWPHYYLLFIPFVLYILRNSNLIMSISKFSYVFGFMIFFTIVPNIVLESGLISNHAYIDGVLVIASSFLLIVALYQDLKSFSVKKTNALNSLDCLLQIRGGRL